MLAERFFVLSPRDGANPLMKCRYCGRPLRKGGIKCVTCRRYVLGWRHLALFTLLGAAAALGLLELLFRFI